MGKWCLHASLFIFDQIIIKVAGNQDRHKNSIKFDFGPNQTTHFGVTCPWVTKISHFRTWISLQPVGQSWSNFMCSIIRVGERLHKVLGQIGLAHWTQVSDRCPLGYLFQELLQLDRVKRIWYLSPMRAAKVQASLRIRAVSPEPSLLAHTSSESRGTFRQKARSLAPLNGWACGVEICHDGMLEDTNSLDGAQLFALYLY